MSTMERPVSDAAVRTTPGGLRQRGDGVEIRLDEQTGLPSGLAASPAGPVVPLRLGIELETGGVEAPGTMGGLTYLGTDRHVALEVTSGSVEHVTTGPEESYAFETIAGEWRVRWTVAFRAEHPRVELRVAVSPTRPSEGVLRDLHLNAELDAGDLDHWRVEAPGNMLRPGVQASAICEPVWVLSAGHELGSPGMTAFHHADEPVTLVVWPFSRSEQVLITLEPSEDALRLHIQTQLAGIVRPGEWLEHGPIYLDVLDKPWSEVRDEVKGWYPSMGIITPRDRPAWTSAVSIFEVMVGSAPFYDGYQYCPYPTLRDLIDDLDRIRELGFECLQLMPRHPYPSYNIHEPGDVSATYGDPTELRALVDACHERGMRIILDILLHGVIDKAVMERTVELVKNGPHATRLDDPCSDPYSFDSVEISWCRHILAFAPYWIDGAPDHHPLLDAHPEWFMRDSEGSVTGVYTHALDIANEDWQDDFITACEAMVWEYEIDGFRLDAPLYNRFANWSETARRHASYSSLGALRLLRELRRRLHALSSDVLLFSEPSGPLVRESLDLTYCYEESWLIPSLFDTEGREAHEWRRVRTGRELAAWCRELDAALPDGSASAHFVDCHDTMWWRLSGDHWRREQVGLPATKALVAIYALRGGAYMTFVGGEQGVEAELWRALALRRSLPEIRDGSVEYDALSVGDEAVYGVLRRVGDRAAIVAVNTSDAPRTCTVVAPGLALDGAQRVFDAWTGEWLSCATSSDDTVRLDLSFAPYQARALILKDPPGELTEPTD
jgi:glycosidase